MAPLLTALIGFVTIDGRHPNLPCENASRTVAHLKLTSDRESIDVPLTCEAAPALAFAVKVPAGRYTVKLEPVAGVNLQPVTTTVVAKGHSTLLTLAARRAPALAWRAAAAAPPQ